MPLFSYGGDGVAAMNSIWSDEEKDFVRVNAGILTDSQIAKKLTEDTGRQVSLQAARKQRQKMKLRKCHGRGVCRLANASP